MATAPLPEIPSDLPPATTSVRDDVFDAFERFMGPGGIERRGGVPVADSDLFGDDFGIKATLKRIRNIPQWERGLNSKPDLKKAWDDYFALLPKWYPNVLQRLTEKNNFLSADEDATAESRELNWMIGRLNQLQNDIDFAAQDAIAPPPEQKFAPAQPDDVKAAVTALDKEVQTARETMTAIASRNGATAPGPKLKDVFKAFRAYVKQWEATKGAFLKADQVPAADTKKALAGFVAEAEAAWSLDNPGKTPAVETAPQAPTPAAKPSSGPTSAAPKKGPSSSTLWLVAGALGLGALYLASQKR